MADMQAQLEAAERGQHPPHVNMQQAVSAALIQVGDLARNFLFCPYGNSILSMLAWLCGQSEHFELQLLRHPSELCAAECKLVMTSQSAGASEDRAYDAC